MNTEGQTEIDGGDLGFFEGGKVDANCANYRELAGLKIGSSLFSVE